MLGTVAAAVASLLVVAMPAVFVSHAYADAPLVEPFVSTVLQLGCEVRREELFYSSGSDTGVPAGTDLLHHVREQVAEAGLVTAIVTPTFQTRPVCVAELGAAWSRTGRLLPIAVPGMERTDLQGVLSGVVVRYLAMTGRPWPTCTTRSATSSGDARRAGLGAAQGELAGECSELHRAAHRARGCQPRAAARARGRPRREAGRAGRVGAGAT